MKITYSAYIWHEKAGEYRQVNNGLLSSQIAMDYLDKEHNGKRWRINRDKTNRAGKLVSSTSHCFFNGRSKLTLTHVNNTTNNNL